MEPIILGEFNAEGYKMRAEANWFADGQPCIVIYSYNEDFKFWEIWTYLTVNLTDYNMIMKDGLLFINHDNYPSGLFNTFYDLFCDTDFGQHPITFGFAQSVAVKLKDEIQQKYPEFPGDRDL